MPPSNENPGSSTPRKLVDGSLIFLIALGVAGGIGVWVLRGPDRFLEILSHELFFSAVLLPKILAGVLIASGSPLRSVIVPRWAVIVSVRR